MRFKEHILNIVRDEHPICNGVEYKRLNAQLQDSITVFMEGLTPAQRVMLDQTILQGFDAIVSVAYGTFFVPIIREVGFYEKRRSRKDR